MELAELQSQLRALLLDNLKAALQLLTETANPGSDPGMEAILLRARFNQLAKDQAAGILSYDDYQRGLNRLRADFLALVNDLTAAALEAPASANITPRAEGALLHQIPPRMAVGQEVRCRVRLAYDQADLLADLDPKLPTEVRSLPVARVMQVRLFDAAAEPAFRVRSPSREEQTLASDAYAEWLFFVQPLRPGQHALLLLVAIVEEVDGRTVGREMVLEEVVEVTTQADTPQAEPAFRPAGLVFGAPPPPEESAAPPPDEASPEPAAPPPPAPAPPAPAPAPGAAPRPSPWITLDRKTQETTTGGRQNRPSSPLPPLSPIFEPTSAQPRPQSAESQSPFKRWGCLGVAVLMLLAVLRLAYSLYSWLTF